MKIFIQITNKDIDNGKPTDPCFCPIVRPEVPVYVKHTYAALGMGGFATCLPSKAQEFINSFDSRALNGQPDLRSILAISPFEFEFDIPEQYLRAA